MGLDKIIINSIIRSAKSTSKFDVAIDDITVKFEESCPPKPELISLIQKKNQIQGGLMSVSKSLESLEKIGNTSSKILNGLSTAVTVIKAIPIPTSVPPGVGIPINILTIYSDVLDALRIAITKGKGIIKVIPESVKIINNLVKQTIAKLGTLDAMFTKCLEELFTESSQEWSPTTNYIVGNTVTYSGEYYKSLEDNNLDKNPSDNSNGGDGIGWWELTTKETLQAEFFTELNFALTEVGNFNDVNLNQVNDTALQASLTVGSNTPIWYKGFLCTLENNPDNTFSFPSRRCKGERQGGTTFVGGSEVSRAFNNPEVAFSSGGAFSYSSSTSVLLDELFYAIDLIPITKSKLLQSPPTFRLKLGTYWMYEDTSFDGGTVYFVSPEGKTISFSTPEQYMAHRKAWGWPQDWSDIEKRQLVDTSISQSYISVDPSNLSTEELSQYSPFGVPGFENKEEVRIRTSLQTSSLANIEYYYKYNPKITSWDIYTPILTPFGVTGSIDEIKVYNTTDNFTPVQDTYKWNNFYFRWNFISREIT
tara:strand:- start:9290 stop:10894 length:1605 start_codon:yes stop_codon:yes gene_type:complete